VSFWSRKKAKQKKVNRFSMKNFIIVGLFFLWVTTNAYSIVPLGNFACPDAVRLISFCLNNLKGVH
jgi:hypothetical protein